MPIVLQSMGSQRVGGDWVTEQNSGVSVSYSPVEVLQSNPIGLQSQILWGFPVLCWIPRLGSLIRSSKPSQQWENFFGISFSSLWVNHIADMGFDLVVIVPLLPSHCSIFFVFGSRVSFFDGFQRPPVDGCSTDSCDFGALTGGDECISSTPPF